MTPPDRNGSETDRTLMLLLEAATQGILVVDVQGRVRMANTALTAMFGWSAGELVGQPMDVLVPPSLRGVHASHRQDYFAAPHPRPMGLGMTLVGQRKNGSTFPLEVSLSHIATPEGGLAIGFVTDITARIQSEAALVESHQRLSQALDVASAAAWTEDIERGSFNLDHRVETLLGIADNPTNPYEAFFAAVHPLDRDRVRATVDAAYAVGGPDGWNFEHRFLQPGGRVAWHQSVARVERDADGRATRIAGITMDITARKTAEVEVDRSHESLRQRAAELEVRTRQLSRLATELTLAEQRTREQCAKALHDGLQQLLFSVRLRVAGVTLPADSASADAARALQLAVSDLDEAIAAARSLAVELFPPALHERGLPAALTWLSGWMGKQYGLKVHVTADPAADPERSEVRILLFESVRELLFNVVKHAQGKGAMLSVTLDPHDRLGITVADEGPGFDAASGLSNAESPVGGMGLFTIRERLALLGGALEIDSAPGRGARFHFTVPRRVVESRVSDPALAPRRGPASTDDTALATDRPVTILIVDDHASVREGLRQMFSDRHGLQVVGQAVNGVEAIDKARALRPDVIVIDVSMPEMDGIEATRRIHAEFPSILIFGFSTHERTEDLHAIEQAGGAGYFTKGADADKLVERILAVRAEAHTSG